eukprot:6467125-Amphidinium_carterae.1
MLCPPCAPYRRTDDFLAEQRHHLWQLPGSKSSKPVPNAMLSRQSSKTAPQDISFWRRAKQEAQNLHGGSLTQRNNPNEEMVADLPRLASERAFQ